MIAALKAEHDIDVAALLDSQVDAAELTSPVECARRQRT
jgi:hypothetical protein